MPIIHSGNKNLAVQYWCENGDNGNIEGLLSGSVVPGKVWRAKRVTYTSSPDLKPKVFKIQTVKIREVWQ